MSPAVWAPVVLLVAIAGLVLSVVRHPVEGAFRKAGRSMYQRRLARWSARQSALESLVKEATTATGVADAASLANAGLSAKLRRGEVVYRLLHGVMVEERSRQNTPTLVVVANGAIAITSSRLLFEGGGKRRQWAYDKLHTITPPRANRTLLGVTNRKAISGIEYGDPERTRMYLDLAIAEVRNGSRASVVTAMKSRLAEHERNHPKEPSQNEPRKLTARDGGILLCCLALLLWPFAPAHIRASDPTAQPSWGWLAGALVLALLGAFFLSRKPDGTHTRRIRRSLGRRAAIAAATATALVIVGGFAVPASALEGTVERVIDGDTIIVDVHGSDLRIRVLNIDTPETVNPQVSDECLGEEASNYTKGLVPPGTRVDLQFDRDRTDRYGRTLAAVNLSDGRSVANELAEAGLGLPIVVGRNDKHFSSVLASFKQSEANERGYFDPEIECTFPAQQAQIGPDLAAAEAATAGITAAQAVAAAAAIYAVYKVHYATSRLIGAGTGFTIRAMKIVGATAGFAAYQASTKSLGHAYRKLDAIADEREQVESEARQRKEAEEQAAAEAVRRAEEERARREAEQSSGGYSDNDDDFNVPGWACPTRWC